MNDKERRKLHRTEFFMEFVCPLAFLLLVLYAIVNGGFK